MCYDVVGDIHGQVGKMKNVLKKLGYDEADGWRPPQNHQAVFLGDLIDRGPAQVEVLSIVRHMVDAGHARCLMGNHELNAIGFATPDGKGGFLRPKSERNISQHREFLRQVGEDSALHKELIQWFRTLPPFLDLGGLRLVHAWWNQAYIDLLSPYFAEGYLSDEGVAAMFVKGSPEWIAIEGITKGLEISLPPGSSFRDHDGCKRFEVRTKWWSERAVSFRDVAIVEPEDLARIPEVTLPANWRHMDADDVPVLVGHYWMKGEPVIDSPRFGCLDYSAARDGPLVAYRWHGEADLSQANLVWSF